MEKLKHFLTDLHDELISKKTFKKRKAKVSMSSGNMRNSLATWHMVSSRIQLEIEQAMLVLSLHPM